jgi:VanZ like family/Concanavalin A-like lectin/glucanases superfamily
MSLIEPRSNALKALLVFICVVILGTTLSAGLWPFSMYVANNVSWRPDEKGLYFGKYGIVISGGRFNGIPNENGCSIEIRIIPSLSWDSSTILSFYETGNAEWIQLRRSGDDLAFSRLSEGPFGQEKQRNVYVDRAFRKGEEVLITMTSAKGLLNIYLNGVLKKSAKNIAFSGSDFSGALILGDSPYGHASFTGIYRGIAFYDRMLAPDEVRQNYATWKGDREQHATINIRPFSFYLFNEEEGEILHNVGKAGPDMVIPKHYFVFRPRFLVPFWKEYQGNWSYGKDLVINVLGLAPLGGCFAALLAWLLGRSHAFLYALILGFCVSLTIEILQAYLPTRSSGTTDLITNTLGSALGAWLYLNAITQSLLVRWGIVQLR